LQHRETSADGKLRFYGNVFHNQDGGDRPNADSTSTTARIDPTYVLDKNTTLYVHFLRRDDEFGVPGRKANPVLDDRAEFRLTEGSVVVRRQIGARNSLWAGIFSLHQREDRANPNRDPSNSFFSGSGANADVVDQQTRTHSYSRELRFDRVLGPQKNGGTFSLGFARPHSKTRIYRRLSVPTPPGQPLYRGFIELQLDDDVSISYAQLAKRLGRRASFIGQLRYQKVPRQLAQSGGMRLVLPDGTKSDEFEDYDDKDRYSSNSYLLPSMVLNYQAGKRTLMRLSASRRVTDISSSIFAPVATLLTTEAQALPNGFPDPGLHGDLYTTQLDLEHYVSRGGLLKFFVFGARAHNLTFDFSRFANPANFEDTFPNVGNSLTLRDVERVGAGVRFEQQLNRSLFGFATMALNRTTSSGTRLIRPFALEEVSAVFNGEIAPYHPKVAAQVGVNYLDKRGNKVGFFANYTGAFFTDTADPGFIDPFQPELGFKPRPRFPARITFDLFLSREPSVRQEFFVQVRNLFNAKQIVYNDIPLSGRRVTVGLTRRF
jgi:hypothetical protein